ncbi:SurA N-terminal domain-containing protein [Arhodomonas sp. AD133]|uniref:SurA N-terminal domain-containing protein n=1 Tax=Arhodomonas sp. AD133 TaxID=3415009 RepID=UPI003EB8112E
MLQAIRDVTRGWVAYVIVAVLIVPFALFGVYNYFTGGSNPPIAKVEGREITRQQLDQAVQQQRQRLRRMLGEQYDPAMFEGEALRRQALEELINSTVVDAFAEREGLRLTDEGLREYISQQAAFQVEGEFSAERYQTVLRQSGLTPDRYEAQLRRQYAASQLPQAVSTSAVVTDEELARFVALQRQQRDVAILRVPRQAFGEAFTADEETLRDYYQSHKDRWRRPEQVKLAFIELSREQLLAQADVDAEAVRERYESLKDTRFTQGGERRVRHILLEAPSDADEATVAAARDKLAEVRSRIVSDELDFAAAAEEFSQDPATADEGGSMGWVARGDLPEALEGPAFDLEAGEISEPVRSDFGWHLVMVADVRDQAVEPFEDVRDELRQELAGEEVENRFYELSNELANLAYENPDSLQPAADALDQVISRTDWISRDGADSGVASEQAVLEAAFSEEVLGERRNSEAIDLGDDRVVVVRVADHRPATIREFEAVREEVRADWLAERTAEKARERGSELQEALAEGGEPQQLAGDGPVAFQAYGWIGRDGGDVPGPIREKAFRMPRPDEDAARQVAGLALPDGSYAVVILRGVRDGKLSDVADEERQQLRSRLRQLDAAGSRQALVQSLRADADVTIYEDRL